MTGWDFAGLVVTSATLLLVVWQVLRFEATQPILGWDVGRSSPPVLEAGTLEVFAWMRPSGPGVLYDVAPFTLGSATMAHTLTRPRMDCESDHLTVTALYRPGSEGYVGFTWLRQGTVRRRAVREALRWDLSGNDPQPEVWKRHIFPRRPSRPQGKWVRRSDKQHRALRIPDVPSAFTDTPLPGGLLGP